MVLEILELENQRRICSYQWISVDTKSTSLHLLCHKELCSQHISKQAVLDRHCSSKLLFSLGLLVPTLLLLAAAVQLYHGLSETQNM